MAAVIDEPAVVDLLADRGRAGGGQPGRKGGTPAARIDHQVSRQLLTGLGPHPGDVDAPGAAAAPVTARRQRRHAGRHARSFLGGRGDGPLYHGPPPRYHVEALVAVAPASGDEVGGTPQDVVLEGAVRLEPGRQIRAAAPVTIW